jgi:hypothetical protein
MVALDWLMSLAPLVRSPDVWAVKLVLLLVEVPELGAHSASSLRRTGWVGKRCNKPR